jgi:lysophospholipase L1-like esterase
MRIPSIELFTTESDNPFLEKPHELFARDGIHPSSRGYQIWYNRMWLEMNKSGFRV